MEPYCRVRNPATPVQNDNLPFSLRPERVTRGL